jgi:DNA (cytosine-5)-methyltransferase 1
MTDLTLVELFAGIGGFSCGFERAGVRTVAAVEIDPAARSVFAKHFPDVTLFNDVREVGANDLRATGFVPERGIITAGWPCQDISRAGRENGLSGDRSGLFYEVMRLLVELRPKWFVLENVPRLLSINRGRDMGAVVGALVDSGYGFAYRVLDASAFGTAQKRRRIFFVGHLGDDRGTASAEVLFDSESVRGSTPQDREAGPTNPAPVASRDGADCWSALTASTLQGGGRRGYRIDAEGVAGGHLIVTRR